MKRNIIILILLLTTAIAVNAQQPTPATTATTITISGRVTDGRQPVAGANVFIKGTIDGCLTDSLGRFSFTTNVAASPADASSNSSTDASAASHSTSGSAVLMVTCLGYDDYLLKLTAASSPLTIVLHGRTASIDEVVVTGSTFSFGQANGLKQIDALDVVLDGGSCGDIVGALQSLPGTQKVGEDGKLYVRGGDSEECQTYINGMHVLRPYTTSAPNSPSRGRFSPFLFKGINFSLGGYDAEYGQALSSVLPMETTDEASSDKLGVSASLIDWNFGGTKSTQAGSWSMNAAYTDLGLYNRLFPDRWTWHKPYRQFSSETQWKMQPTASSVWKTYLGFDRTTLSLDTDAGTPGARTVDAGARTMNAGARTLSLGENNLYLNSVIKGSAKGGLTWFAGMAGSMVWENIDGAVIAGDHYRNRPAELHLKAKVSKGLSSAVKGTLGAEGILRHAGIDYRTAANYGSAANYGTASGDLYSTDGYSSDHHYSANTWLPALFAEAQLRLTRHLFAETSLRTEYTNSAHRWSLLPRVLINYRPTSRWLFTLSAGQYTQEATDTIRMRSIGGMRPATASHYIAGAQYHFGKTHLRLEAYTKRYHHLPLLRQGLYTADGHGVSRGFDVYADDNSLLSDLVTTLSYSYNDARRLYLDYTDAHMPQYASRHNLRLSLKYGFNIWSFGLVESCGSGRHREGRPTPPFNSLDANVTCLVSKRVIVYSSLSNLLGRRNIYGYHNGQPVTNGANRFFYIGVFVSLKSNKAYDIANF